MQKVLIAILFIVTIMVTILFFNKPSSLPKANKSSFNEEINITKKEPHRQMNTE